MSSLCMDLNKVLELLAAVENTLEFIDGQRDSITDPDSEVGAQMPNRACHIWEELNEAYEAANAEYDRAKEEQDEWHRSYEYKRQRRMAWQEDQQ